MASRAGEENLNTVTTCTKLGLRDAAAGTSEAVKVTQEEVGQLVLVPEMKLGELELMAEDSEEPALGNIFFEAPAGLWW